LHSFFALSSSDAPAFRAPEHGFPGHKRPNQDVWSVGILVAELAAGRPLYDASVKNREILKIYGDVDHDLHPSNLHKTMPELQGLSDAFHDFLDEVGRVLVAIVAAGAKRAAFVACDVASRCFKVLLSVPLRSIFLNITFGWRGR
jgi:hypothetical protein